MLYICLGSLHSQALFLLLILSVTEKLVTVIGFHSLKFSYDWYGTLDAIDMNDRTEGDIVG